MMKRTILILSTVLITVLGLISCNNDEGVEPNEFLPKPGKNFNFYTSGKLYQEGLKSASLNYSKQFEIELIARKDGKLKVVVSYIGTCASNKYDIIWDGAIAESWPMQVRLLMKREAQGSKKDNVKVTETIEIDLKNYVYEDAAVANTVFFIINGSKKPGEDGATKEVTVSN